MKKFDEQFSKDRVNTFPFVKLMGMKLLSSGGGKSVMRCRIRPLLRNTAGTLHGGGMGALVDMSVATALRSVMDLSCWMTTVEYKVDFLKPVFEGIVTAPSGRGRKQKGRGKDLSGRRCPWEISCAGILPCAGRSRNSSGRSVYGASRIGRRRSTTPRGTTGSP